MIKVTFNSTNNRIAWMHIKNLGTIMYDKPSHLRWMDKVGHPQYDKEKVEKEFKLIKMIKIKVSFDPQNRIVNMINLSDIFHHLIFHDKRTAGNYLKKNGSVRNKIIRCIDEIST
jgi:hypothetical protein